MSQSDTTENLPERLLCVECVDWVNKCKKTHLFSSSSLGKAQTKRRLISALASSVGSPIVRSSGAEHTLVCEHLEQEG